MLSYEVLNLKGPIPHDELCYFRRILEGSLRVVAFRSSWTRLVSSDVAKCRYSCRFFPELFLTFCMRSFLSAEKAWKYSLPAWFWIIGMKYLSTQLYFASKKTMAPAKATLVNFLVKECLRMFEKYLGFGDDGLELLAWARSLNSCFFLLKISSLNC